MMDLKMRIADAEDFVAHASRTNEESLSELDEVGRTISEIRDGLEKKPNIEEGEQAGETLTKEEVQELWDAIEETMRRVESLEDEKPPSIGQPSPDVTIVE